MADKNFAFQHPDDALRAIADRLSAGAIETNVSIDDCLGRVLVSNVVADRDSPAADVSAMDGYAVRLSDLNRLSELPIHGQSAPGRPAPALTDGTVVRIFTGAIVPSQCDAVIKREDTQELEGAIRVGPAARLTDIGQHIRRAGENAKAGSTVLTAGTLITAAQLATMANFGSATVDLYKRLKVTIITTGDEVGDVFHHAPEPWQLRNSNRSSLAGLIGSRHWIDVPRTEHCPDDRQVLTDTLAASLERSDAILLTGGVSMGNYDYVPDVVGELGGDIVFHGLPIRPGKPILGAVTAKGKLIVGLPGNPVSATIGCRRMALPLLAKQSGQMDWLRPCPLVSLRGAGNQSIPLHWLRLAKLTQDGLAETVLSQGSGDLVSLGQSTGFVEVPADQSGEGPWPYYSWD